jgi:hypothetical protein
MIYEQFLQGFSLRSMEKRLGDWFRILLDIDDLQRRIQCMSERLHARLFFNPFLHNIKGKPDVPDLTVVLGMVLFGKDACGHQPGIS